MSHPAPPSRHTCESPYHGRKGEKGEETGQSVLVGAGLASCWQALALLLSLSLSFQRFLLWILAFSPPCFLTQSQNVPQSPAPAGRDPAVPRLCHTWVPPLGAPAGCPPGRAEAPLGQHPFPFPPPPLPRYECGAALSPSHLESPLGAALGTKGARSVLEVQTGDPHSATSSAHCHVIPGAGGGAQPALALGDGGSQEGSRTEDVSGEGDEQKVNDPL